MNTKTTPKSCSCKACKRGKASAGGHFYRKADERAYAVSQRRESARTEFFAVAEVSK